MTGELEFQRIEGTQTVRVHFVKDNGEVRRDVAMITNADSGACLVQISSPQPLSIVDAVLGKAMDLNDLVNEHGDHR